MTFSPLFDAELAHVAMAAQHQASIAGLHVQTDTLLDPICKRAIERAQAEDYTLIRECIKVFPGGFHRTELRTYCNQNGIELR